MTNPQLSILVDRLKKGQSESIDETVSPEFLVEEKDLKFTSPIVIKGDAYLAEDELVLQLNIETTAQARCSVCNQMKPLDIQVKNLTHLQPLDELKGQKFDFTDVVREAILLEVPFVVECSEGHCPERQNIEKFLADPKKEDNEEGYRPFKDL
jgi:uncharacterized metal-binding protein YceD (DUF177 family)